MMTMNTENTEKKIDRRHFNKGNKRVSADGHKLTQTEINRRFSDRQHSIDNEMNTLFSEINWERRKEAESDIIKWVKTYCIGIFLEDAPPERGEQVLRQMWNALDSHNNYMILMGRGSGKSVYELCTTMASISQGIQKFIVIISNNSRASANLLKDLWRMVSTPHTAFAQDYPEIVGPYTLANGSLRRRQLFNGQSTELSKTSCEIVFPTLVDKDGKHYPTSGSVVTCRGLNSGIRGLRRGTQRVTCVLLDDLQDKEIATNPEQVAKVIDTIKKDIIPLAGKDRLSIIQTATPICSDDLVERIKEDKTWKTTLFPAIISYPINKDLWKEYFKLYDAELMEEEVKHDVSLQFYKDNFDEMNEGSDVFNPSRYSTKDGHISMIQKLMELRHAIGEEAFDAEYQMKPHRASYSLVVSPKYIKEKLTNTKVGEIPDGHILTVASTDLNLSKYCTTTIWTFKRDMTAVCIYHHLTKCNIDMKLSDAEYNRQVVQVLEKVGREIKATGIPLFGWAIDANGVPYTAVTDFCKTSKQTVGIQATGFIGKASHMFNGFVRSRLRNEINRTVLCGDAQEQVKAGAGRKYTFWDSDLYREMVQRAMMSPLGISGGASLYKGTQHEHDEFAMQFCNEQLKFVKRSSDGRNHYEWQSKEPHDYLDSSAQAFALAASLGISGTNYGQTTKTAPKQVMKKRVRYKIV